jgi:hypothetical protein
LLTALESYRIHFVNRFFFRIAAEKEQLVLEHRKALYAQQGITAALKDRLMQAELRHGRELKEAQDAAEAQDAGADAALRVACSWYVDLDLDALHSLRGVAPTDKDPLLTAKRQDRAYRITEFARFHTFIPPPEDIKDEVSDDEEEGSVEGKEEDAEEGEAPPEHAPEAPSAGPQPPIA